MIQDYIMTVVSVAFCLALVPQVTKGFREQRATVTLLTSGITGVGLYISAMCAVTLGLPFTALVWAVLGGLWSVLFWQGVAYGR